MVMYETIHTIGFMMGYLAGVLTRYGIYLLTIYGAYAIIKLIIKKLKKKEAIKTKK